MGEAETKGGLHRWGRGLVEPSSLHPLLDLACPSVTRSAFPVLDICAVGTEGHTEAQGHYVMCTVESGQGHSQEGQSPLPQCGEFLGGKAGGRGWWGAEERTGDGA